KLASIGATRGISVVALHVFTGTTFPVFVAAPHGFVAGLRSLAAWWITALAAGSFVLSAALALQGVAAQLLSRRAFLRISGILQLTSLFIVIALFFVTPP